VSVECTLPAAGTLSGCTRRDAPARAASRLCKVRLGQLAARLAGGGSRVYRALKTGEDAAPEGAALPRYRRDMQAFHARGDGFEGWRHSDPAEDVFEVGGATS
jgi:hypothetical protein